MNYLTQLSVRPGVKVDWSAVKLRAAEGQQYSSWLYVNALIGEVELLRKIVLGLSALVFVLTLLEVV